jgi:exosome complex component RRP46
MGSLAAPEAALSVLPKADGSATYSYAGYTITASVNGPIEAQRRDEHPYEAHVDVIVRPAAGVGGARVSPLSSTVALERWLTCVATLDFSI